MSQATPTPEAPLNPGQQQLAAIYAKAFLGAAKTAGEILAIFQERGQK